MNRSQASAEQLAFYDRIDQHDMAPLWEVLKGLLPQEPKSPCVPAHWRWETTRPHLLEAGRLIGAKEAERRVLVLENPALRGRSCITQTLYAGLQLILPGEIAPSHRHTATAVRLILEGTGGYTTVDGERTPMHRGDFIITPSWSYHDHGNDGAGAVIWLDGLDVPLVRFFDAGFSQQYPEDVQPLTKPYDDSLACIGPGVMVDSGEPVAKRNPLFRYPYEEVRSKLHRLHLHGHVHRAHGVRLRYINPATGGWPTLTMAAWMHLLPTDFAGDAVRRTDATVFCVVEGEGRTQVGEREVEWAPGDVFVAPSWTAVAHRADRGAVLFAMSDRPVQEAAGIWREVAA
ncbi:gentisate 1,2-dioxygenase [Hydrogenophaga palleronii]|uniref:Gentisate 1,2-dioxygenase n=1 Tax=Hydrogenophaga palleronii TaxID=65655 RepID=A0ABU1WSI3_9BURK|nr:gentisate 1,2-dioxygenase [Hydrogenophaga palleronii]MDR7152034.1 gentisate 1,2-dioxygenase [Hydrogenophaga palleronii]